MIKFLLLIILIITGFVWWQWPQINSTITPEILQQPVSNVKEKVAELKKPKIELQTPPDSKVLTEGIHVFQSYNNCGPAALSMALSYYGISETQQKLGQELRPYQVPGGDNDDKSVTLEEVAEKSKEYGLTPYRRPNGNIDLIKLFITYDIPVITRTWLKVNEDIGHYRIIKGYGQNFLIQDDSLQGKNLQYSFNDFNDIWKKFNYEYLVLVPKDKIEIAETIMGEDSDFKTAWTKSIKLSEDQLLEDPNDIYARFNLSVAYYNIGNYQKSTEEFEKVEKLISFRTLWYQIEPIQAYFELENYDRVLEITDRVLNYHNRAFSELYILRGEIYKKQGKLDLARTEFEKAVFYNVNLKSAQEALNSLN